MPIHVTLRSETKRSPLLEARTNRPSHSRPPSVPRKHAYEHQQNTISNYRSGSTDSSRPNLKASEINAITHVQRLKRSEPLAVHDLRRGEPKVRPPAGLSPHDAQRFQAREQPNLPAAQTLPQLQIRHVPVPPRRPPGKGTRTMSAGDDAKITISHIG